MKQIAELVPLILFVLAFKYSGTELQFAGYSHTLDGIYSATAVLMIATVIQVVFVGIIYRHIEKRQWWMLGAILVFGAMTIVFRNELFIMWKPTVFNWGMAVVFLVAPVILNGQTLLEKAMASQVPMPKAAWRKLNILWVCHFTIVGLLNIVVAYQYSQAFWVDYKLYSAIVFTLILSVLTMLIITPYLKDSLQEEVSADSGAEPTEKQE